MNKYLQENEDEKEINRYMTKRHMLAVEWLWPDIQVKCYNIALD